MTLIKIDEDTFKEETIISKTIVKSDIEAEITSLQEELAKEPSDEELLVFARATHPYYFLQEELDKKTAVITKLDKLTVVKEPVEEIIKPIKEIVEPIDLDIKKI